MQTWELITSLGSIHRVQQRLYLIPDHKCGFECRVSEISRQFGLDPSLCEFIAVSPGNGSGSKRDHMAARDRLIVAESDVLLPISLRKNSSLDKLMLDGDDGKINRDFETAYEKRIETISYNLARDQLNKELLEIGEQYITHWTRAFNGPWPTERPLDYYTAILNSPSYPRKALHSLLNIVSSGRVAASSNHMPKSTPVVSFSALPPGELTELIRWRARYSQMSFEPYGLGIERELAIRLGILPVEYYDGGNESGRSDNEAWLTQSRGRITDWTNEMEYRHLGDFDLSAVPKEKMILFCHTHDEADLLREQSGMRVVSFIA